MWFKHSMSIAQQLITIYNTTMHKNKSNVALNVAYVRVINYRHQHATRAEKVSRLRVSGYKCWQQKTNMHFG